MTSDKYNSTIISPSLATENPDILLIICLNALGDDSVLVVSRVKVSFSPSYPFPETLSDWKQGCRTGTARTTQIADSKHRALNEVATLLGHFQTDVMQKDIDNLVHRQIQILTAQL
jgi:hypothetical protein